MVLLDLVLCLCVMITGINDEVEVSLLVDTSWWVVESAGEEQ